jgi:hypothetical protein
MNVQIQVIHLSDHIFLVCFDVSTMERTAVVETSLMTRHVVKC